MIKEQDIIISREKEKEPKKILIIDDDESIIEVTKCAIKHYFPNNSDIYIIQCINLNEAKKAIDEYEPDVLFFDHFLNGNVGFEILEYAREKGIKENYAITGNSSFDQEYAERKVKKIGKVFIIETIEEILKK
ncbi:MAG: hypothetical protein AAB526_00420 [Patescibacteria group bacterium]